MPVIICPFCQHENNSGTRFCNECGCSIHLKICPNPQCGKVSEVDAEICQSCGQPFPTIALVPTMTTNAVAPSRSQKQDGTKAPPRAAAWPLIIVAIVAGGLPLLWANRSLLPTPKTWQTNTADTTKTGVVGRSPVEPTPPPTPTSSASTTPPANAAVPGEPGSGSSASSMDTPGGTEKNEGNQPATGGAPKKVVKAPRVKTTERPRPCTEATVALGLCDPKQAAK